MLALTRRINEEVCIGDDIVVRITEVGWSHGVPKVRLAITAPAHVRVDRREIRDRRLRQERRPA